MASTRPRASSTDGSPTRRDGDVDELDGLRVAPGFIDLQCNGGLGIDLASEPERLWELGALLPRFGVTAWLPTIVTTPDGVIERALDSPRGRPAGRVERRASRSDCTSRGRSCRRPKRGAHPEALLREPTLDAIEGWTRDAGVALVTIAPDLPGALEVIAALVERGVIVSLGHTPATAEQAAAAVDAGARWVTHLFNAMAPMHHREPGLAGVALSDERLHVGLIPDGIHVHPHVVTAAQRALGERLTIVTDAVAALGMPRRPAGARAHRGARRRHRACAWPTGRSPGATSPWTRGCATWSPSPAARPPTAIHAASTAPAHLLGDPTRGHLEPGARADLVVLTEDLHVVSTYVGGELVHDARWSR